MWCCLYRQYSTAGVTTSIGLAARLFIDLVTYWQGRQPSHQFVDKVDALKAPNHAKLIDNAEPLHMENLNLPCAVVPLGYLVICIRAVDPAVTAPRQRTSAGTASCESVIAQSYRLYCEVRRSTLGPRDRDLRETPHLERASMSLLSQAVN